MLKVCMVHPGCTELVPVEQGEVIPGNNMVESKAVMYNCHACELGGRKLGST